MLTKPSSISKGQEYSFSLVKTELRSVIPVIANDPRNLYYRDEANWDKVTIRYVSSVGGQLIQVTMDASVENMTGKFSSSPRVRDAMEVQSIIISDFDGGNYPIARDLLNPLEFDIDFE